MKGLGRREVNGFRQVTKSGRIAFLREDVADLLIENGVTESDGSFSREPGARFYHGRGRPVSVPLRGKEGERMVIRHYHHGGIFRHLTRDIFLGRPFRPLRELRASEWLRARGIETPEVLAVIINKKGLLFYQGEIITREIESSLDAKACFFDSPPGEEEARRQAIRSLAKLVAKLHEEGVDHPDLNLKNLLLQRKSDNEFKAYILDLDRVRIRSNLSRRRKARILCRLKRSVEKFNREQLVINREDMKYFLQEYGWEGQKTCI